MIDSSIVVIWMIKDYSGTIPACEIEALLDEFLIRCIMWFIFCANLTLQVFPLTRMSGFRKKCCLRFGLLIHLNSLY